LKKQLVLVVDDEADFREILEVEFQEAGLETLSAASGLEALEVISNHRVDALVTDYRMPHGDGFFLLDEMRKRGLKVPVVIFVSGNMDLDPDELKKRGVTASVGKPFDIDELIELILKNLAQSTA
jgi:CheY-like chemotaxis protein